MAKKTRTAKRTTAKRTTAKRTTAKRTTAKRKPVKRAKPVNKLFPLQPGYRGPKRGAFAFLHHSQLAEWTSNILHRVHYVKRQKPQHEQAARRACLMYLGTRLSARVHADESRHGYVVSTPLRQDIIAYIKRHNTANLKYMDLQACRLIY